MHTRRHVRTFLLLSALILLFAFAQSAALQVGDPAPDFELQSTQGEKVRLADYRGKQPVVLFFYIGAFTRL